MQQIIAKDNLFGKSSPESFFNQLESGQIFSKSTQFTASQQFPPLKNFRKEISQTSPTPKILQSSVLRVKQADQFQLGIHRTNTPLISIRRKHKAGKLKDLIEIKQCPVNLSRQKMRYQDIALPINVTKLTSPFLIQLLNKGFISRNKDQTTKQKKNSFRHTQQPRPSQQPSPKKRIQKSLKQIYQRQFLRNRNFYDIPLHSIILQHTTFLNIESIKPLNPEEISRRKSVMSVAKKVQQKIDIKAKRKSFDTTIGFNKTQTSKQLLSTKPSPSLRSFKTTTKVKQFRPPYQKYYYRDFIWKIAFSHSFCVQIPVEQPKQFRIFIGNGNNRLLIKSLIKLRSWWIAVEKYDENCHFAWTQIKLPEIFKNQSKNNKPEIMSDQDLKDEYIYPNKIFTEETEHKWNSYFKMKRSSEQKSNEQMVARNKYFNELDRIVPYNLRVHNHLENNYVIGNKKALFQTMSQYYELSGKNVFDYLPITFHIESGTEDPQYTKFLSAFYEKAKRLKRIRSEEGEGSSSNTKLQTNAWIVKPGEFTNRGTGIRVCLTLDQIKGIIRTKQKHPNGNAKTYIVQTYLDKPLLYNKRKFDIRHYMMISSLNGVIRGYWYEQGYLRTTSFQYNLGNCSSGIHLTNDAIQKYLPEYGKYQKGNKLSYMEFQQYVQKNYGSKNSFYRDVYPRMKQIATDAIKASYLYIDMEKREHNFEIFGMDFMIDQNFQPWLLEINTNPCLQLSCPLLARLIPQMVQNSFLIGLDPLFPPPAITINKGKPFKDNYSETNRFHLVFDSSVEGKAIQRLYSGQLLKQNIQVSEDDEVYDDDGKELQQ